MEPVVELRGVVCVAGGYPTLAGVDLDVSAGDVCLVSGGNGAGKTSLLRLCAGLSTPVDGRAVVLGVDLCRDPLAVRRSVGLLGHGTGCYEDLSPRENLAFFARAAGLPVRDIEPALDRLEVPARVRGIAMQSLSAGQRRRVALAGLVVRRPLLWLLDEPHTGVDADGRDVVDELLIDAASSGATVMFASHELDRGMAVATREVKMAGGAVIAEVRSAEAEGSRE